jgi:hypothetical protein
MAGNDRNASRSAVPVVILGQLRDMEVISGWVHDFGGPGRLAVGRARFFVTDAMRAR